MDRLSRSRTTSRRRSRRLLPMRCTGCSWLKVEYDIGQSVSTTAKKTYFTRHANASGDEISMDTESIFNLSPSEKLQLVEALWDDLAANPADVPVHNWQMDELARRKANLLRNPASEISWVALKSRVRNRR